jgi:hypothetical protein
VAQAKERLAELLQQAVKQLSSFGADAESLRVVAAQVVGRAVAEKLSSKIEESHP